MAGTLLVCCQRVISFSVDSKPHVPFRKCTTQKNICIHFKGGLGEQSRRSIVLIIAIVLLSRNKSFPRNLCSRSSKNSLSVSKLDPRNSILENQNSKIKTRKSKLETRASKLDSRKLRGSRIQFRVKTVNLPLSGTVKSI